MSKKRKPIIDIEDILTDDFGGGYGNSDRSSRNNSTSGGGYVAYDDPIGEFYRDAQALLGAVEDAHGYTQAGIGAINTGIDTLRRERDKLRRETDSLWTMVGGVSEGVRKANNDFKRKQQKAAKRAQRKEDAKEVLSTIGRGVLKTVKAVVKGAAIVLSSIGKAISKIGKGIVKKIEHVKPFERKKEGFNNSNSENEDSEMD